MNVQDPVGTSTMDQTKVDRVYHHLRQLIRDLKLPPGTHLQKDEIAAELGVSRAPVSEAIARLAEEMLVDVFPRHGSFVAPIRAHEIRECLFIRISLEVEAARRVALVADESMCNRLDDNLADQGMSLDRGNLVQFYELDEVFHRILFDCIGYPRASRMNMTARVPTFRPRQFARLLEDRADHTFQEHRNIADAIRINDPEYAGAAMRAHLMMTAAAVEDALRHLDEDEIAGA